MTTIAIAIPAAVGVLCGFLCGFYAGRTRGWREARDVIVPRLDSLRAEADNERVQRALLTSVRGGRA